MVNFPTKCPVCGSEQISLTDETYKILSTSEETDGMGQPTEKFIDAKASLCKNCKFLMFFKSGE